MTTRPTELTDAERDVLLTPCACGHTLNDHGSLAGCWMCGDEGGECGTSCEALIVERVERIVDARAKAAMTGETQRALRPEGREMVDRVSTPRPWPELQMPTAEQYRDWFLTCTPEEQTRLAEGTLEAVDQAANCFLMNHDNMRRRAQQLRQMGEDEA